MRPFDRALAECARWGVPVEDVAPFAVPDVAVSSAPQHTAWLFWSKTERCIFWRDRRDAGAACALMHELAHAVVGVPPDDADELGAMMALEHEAARRLRFPWFTWMCDYPLSPPRWHSTDGVLRMKSESWSELSRAARIEMLADARIDAERLGIMRDGKPTYVRARSAA